MTDATILLQYQVNDARTLALRLVNERLAWWIYDIGKSPRFWECASSRESKLGLEIKRLCDETVSIAADRDFWKHRAQSFELGLIAARNMMTDEQKRELADLCRGTRGACFCGCHSGSKIMIERSGDTT